MRLVLTDAATLGEDISPQEWFAPFGEVEIYPLTQPAQVAERIAGAQAVLCNKTRIAAADMEQAPQLRYIGLFATGYNNIDVEAARCRGITVCNVPGYSTDAVAQHTFALLLARYSRVAEFDAYTRAGRWQYSRTFSPYLYQTHEVTGRTIGIVGYGSIGRRVAQIAQAIGMKVLVYTRTPRPAEGVTFVSFPQLLRESDVITVHCPLNAASEKMFDAAAFAACKPGAYFINTTRGGVVDEAALRDAVLHGPLSGAAVDVVTQEPMPGDCPLAGVPGITITPHVAWAPVETRGRLMQMVQDNLRAFLAGRPQNTV